MSVLAAQISGVDLGALINPDDDPPPLEVQRHDVVTDAAEEGLDLTQERSLRLEPGGEDSWVVQFSGPPSRSDELRVYGADGGELVLRYRLEPWMTLRPGGAEYPVSIRLEPTADYDRDGLSDLVGSLAGPRNADNFPVRPFVTRYVTNKQSYDTFPLRGDHLELTIAKTFRLPSGRLARKGTPLSSEFARDAFVRDGRRRPGDLYEGVFEFALGYSERLHAAVALVAYAPRLDKTRRSRRWQIDAFALDWNGERPRSAKCHLPLDRQVIVGRSLYLTDVRRELRERLPYVSPRCM